MLFARRDTKDTAKILRLKAAEWRQGEVLRLTKRRRWDADPSAKCMVLRRRDYGELALTAMRWGLAPEWEQGEARPLVNVRAETVAEQVEWRRLLNTHRCLIPTEQFFEWKRIGGVKTREYLFKLRTRRPMMIAGLWRKAAAGETADTFAYISCPANRLVGFIHERMPVVLEDGNVAAWLNPDASLENLLGLLRPLRDGELELHPVAHAETRAKPYQPSLFASRAA